VGVGGGGGVFQKGKLRAILESDRKEVTAAFRKAHTEEL
jgi:hypothetical protein